MKFGHINLVARDLDLIVSFYVAVFGCVERGERRRLAGAQFDKGNGLLECEIFAARLSLPGVDGLFLEIFEYKARVDRGAPAVNAPGFGHLSFDVPDIEAALEAALTAGGTRLGEITNLGSESAPCLCVYLRDPEGNILELEQS